MIIAHPLFCQRLQFFGNVDLPGAALGVAHGQIIGWTVFLALHALTARLATLREPLNEGGTQNGTQPAKLLDELAPTQRELMYLRTRHVLTLARVLRQCKQKMFGKALFLLRSRPDRNGRQLIARKLTGGKLLNRLDKLSKTILHH